MSAYSFGKNGPHFTKAAFSSLENLLYAESSIMILCLRSRLLFIYMHSAFLFAASDHLPEVPDHHADPDPESTPVCCTSLPYSWGISHKHQPLSNSWSVEGLNYFRSVSQCYGDLSTERPTGYPAFAQLLGGQSAPADRPAGLQGAQQGLFTAS